MNNFWLGSFVRITNQNNDYFAERGQVVDHNNGIVVIRYGTGQHAVASTYSVCMDTDQSTPVWPPSAPE